MSTTTPQTQGFTILVGVTAEAAVGEVVAVSILRPDGVTDSASGVTVQDPTTGQITAPIVYYAPLDGIYNETPSIGADSEFSAAVQPAPFQFTVTQLLQSRSINTISVTPIAAGTAPATPAATTA